MAHFIIYIPDPLRNYAAQNYCIRLVYSNTSFKQESQGAF